jgi:glycosyltransferase involved in cell wall biosynthesis
VTAPRVSIVLPTYNRASFLPQAVDSVLRQTEPHWELIIADDGSTDGTAAYLDSVKDPRVRVMRLPHVGHPESVRNRAVATARTALVAFLDSDDWWEPGKLALQLDALADNPAAGWSFTWFRFVDERGAMLPTIAVPRAIPDAWALEQIISGVTPVLTPTVLVRRALLEELGGFDETLPVASDFDLWTRLAAASPAAFVAEPLVVRRRHAGHYSGNHRKNRESFELVFRKLYQRTGPGRMRRLVVARKTQWLVKFANARRGEGAYREAWAALAAAGPAGPRSLGWWTAVLRGVLHPLVPRRLLSAWRRARGAGAL